MRVTSFCAVAFALLTITLLTGCGQEEEKTDFDVVLASIGDQKINVIKEVRALTGLGLKEAKEVVDNLGTVMEGASKESAEEAKAKLEEAGAVIELQ